MLYRNDRPGRFCINRDLTPLIFPTFFLCTAPWPVGRRGAASMRQRCAQDVFFCFVSFGTVGLDWLTEWNGDGIGSGLRR